MTYSVPPRWGHGNTNATPARFNILSDDLTALYASLVGDHQAVAQLSSGQTATLLNTRRWLHYMTIAGETGTIADPAGVGASMSLTDSDTTMAVYDLSGVSWLTQGQVYNVTGCQYVAEDSDA